MKSCRVSEAMKHGWRGRKAKAWGGLICSRRRSRGESARAWQRVGAAVLGWMD
jgi:hypothetical protein